MPKQKKEHAPATQRKIGLKSLKYYFIGGILAGTYLFLISIPVLTETESLATELFQSAMAEVAEQEYLSKKRSEIENSRIIALSVFILILMTYFLMGTKYSFIKTPAIIPNHFYLYSLLFLGWYLYSLTVHGGSPNASIWVVCVALFPPFFMMTLPVTKLATIEYFKDHPFYRRLFILGKGGESSRLGGLREYINKDMGNPFSKHRNNIKDKETSDIYLGQSYFENDLKIAGRNIGLIGTEQHMLTFGETGSGKSRDAVWNTLPSYRGGLIAYDSKGEHFRVTSKKRAEYAPVHVLDPYSVVSDMVETDYWNPLEEIDINSPAARDELKNIAAASIFKENMESGDSSHFLDNSQIIYRGFIAYVIITYPREQRHLGTVYNLIKSGDPTGQTYSPKAMANLLIQMLTCKGIAGAARDAAGILMNVGEREKGSYFSTIARGVDWINSPPVLKVITQASTFSVRDAKSKESSIYFVLPEKFEPSQIRFLRTFYSMAFDFCDNNSTPQPQGSKRRVLFLFDEFYQLGRFTSVEKALLTKRSSYLKFWFIMQNLGQLEELYGTATNFTGSCDKQFFGTDQMDTKTLNLISEAIGSYTQKTREGKEGETNYKEDLYSVLSPAELSEILDINNDGQIIIPAKGKPLLLKRIPYYKNYSKSQYRERKF